MRRGAILLTLLASSCSEPAAEPRAASSSAELRGRVVRVVDGDTLHVRVSGGSREKVRLLGIDTPEMPSFGNPAECGARSATASLARRARGSVVLVTDPTQARRDRFGRLLAYVETPGGRDLNREQVRTGWGRTYVYDRPFRRVGSYRAAERAARRERAGLHSAC